MENDTAENEIGIFDGFGDQLFSDAEESTSDSEVDSGGEEMNVDIDGTEDGVPTAEGSYKVDKQERILTESKQCNCLQCLKCFRGSGM